jgi:cysteine desulfurase
LIYLDHNATTPVDPAVFAEMEPWLRGEGFGNPSSSYTIGRRAAEAVSTARERVASLIGCNPECLIFTSCGTESITTAILSCAARDPDRRKIVTSSVEHSATVKLCEHLAMRGYEIVWIPVDADGLLDLDALREAVDEETALVSLLLANNETGVLFPIEEIAAITSSSRVPLHIDAVQGVGKIPVEATQSGAQFLSLSGHKLHAPKGIGALYVDPHIRFQPLLRGSQEDARRGGTQNVASIVALGKAAELAAAALHSEPHRQQTLRDRLESGILENVPGSARNGHPTLRLPNTSNLAFEGIESEGALILLDERGICCSAGSACTSGSVHPSHVLRAMGFSNDRARSSLRFSIGRTTSNDEINEALHTIPAVIEKLRALRPTTGPVA